MSAKATVRPRVLRKTTRERCRVGISATYGSSLYGKFGTIWMDDVLPGAARSDREYRVEIVVTMTEVPR